MVSLLNHEYCLGSRSGCERPLYGPVTAIQYQALVRLTTAAEMMILHCPSEIGSKDWERNLKCSRINYDGSEGGVVEGVTARQIEAAMPPDGLAGSVDILPLLPPGTR